MFRHSHNTRVHEVLRPRNTKKIISTTSLRIVLHRNIERSFSTAYQEGRKLIGYVNREYDGDFYAYAQDRMQEEELNIEIKRLAKAVAWQLPKKYHITGVVDTVRQAIVKAYNGIDTSMQEGKEAKNNFLNNMLDDSEFKKNLVDRLATAILSPLQGNDQEQGSTQSQLLPPCTRKGHFLRSHRLHMNDASVYILAEVVLQTADIPEELCFVREQVQRGR